MLKCLCSEKFTSTEILSSQRDFEMLKIGVCNFSISRFFLEILGFVSYINDPARDVSSIIFRNISRNHLKLCIYICVPHD